MAEAQDELLENSFEKAINEYARFLNTTKDLSPLVMELVIAKIVQETQHINQFVSSKSVELDPSEVSGVKNSDEDKEESYYIKETDFKEFDDLVKKLNSSGIGLTYLPINFVVSFVSRYDAYLGDIIRAIFSYKPQILNTSDKNLSFTELINFSNMEEAKGYIIEKEVESVIRENHVAQFEWLERKLEMPLRKDLPSFKKFVEITERRNLFVHTNGVVSRHYITTCKKHGVDNIGKIKIGQQLNVLPSYLTESYEVIFEIGIKLGQVIWRKLQPDQIEKADANLNSICFDLLVSKEFNLAINLLSFATDTLPRLHSQEWKYIFIINKALAYYLLGRKDEVKSILDKTDWSATSDIFKLGLHVLNEEYSKAVEIMIAIGSRDQQLNKNSYRDWPLFNHFRKTELFASAYKAVFNEEFVHVEPKPRSLMDIAQNFKETMNAHDKDDSDVGDNEVKETTIHIDNQL